VGTGGFGRGSVTADAGGDAGGDAGSGGCGFEELVLGLTADVRLLNRSFKTGTRWMNLMASYDVKRFCQASGE
jgi:hypothetical protein